MRLANRIELRLAWREFIGAKLLWALSASAVALGVAVIVASDVTRGAVLNAMRESPDVRTLMGGLTDQLGSNLTSLGIGISLASGFIVFNAFGMSFARRRRRFATLRTVGMTGGQVLLLTLSEAMLTGLFGVALGLAGGPWIGRLTIAALKAVTPQGMFLFEAGLPSAGALGMAGLVGLGVALASALIPAVAATQVSPLAARRPTEAAGLEHSPAWRGWVGLAGLGLILVYLWLAPPAAWLKPPWDARLAGLFGLVWFGCLGLLAPSASGLLGRAVRAPLGRVGGATGLLLADNLRRGRRRVALTVLSMAAGISLVVGVMGFTRFATESLMVPKLREAMRLGAWVVAAFDPLAGMTAYVDTESLRLDPQAIADVQQAIEGRGEGLEFGYLTVPELSFFGSSYFSFVMRAEQAATAGEWLFSFNEGNWENALQIMQRGCGVLIMPSIAARLGAVIGDPIAFTGPRGPVPCTVAGIGAAFVAASIIVAPEESGLGAGDPFALLLKPGPGQDRGVLERDLMQLAQRRPGLSIVSMEAMGRAQQDILSQVPVVLDAMAVLAVIAASLGVVNTLTTGVVERRPEFGLLRAVGATRRQILTVVTGEAALIASLGGALGLIGGAGITIIIATVYGGASWGLTEMDHWREAANALGPALTIGLVGWAATPLIGALSGLLPAQSILRRRRLVEELLAERH